MSLTSRTAFGFQTCDGTVRAGELPALGAAAFGLERPPVEDVERCLDTLVGERLLHA